MLHAPPTVPMVQSIPTLAVAVDTIGGYNWRHQDDFSISILNPPNHPQVQEMESFFLKFWSLVVNESQTTASRAVKMKRTEMSCQHLNSRLFLRLRGTAL